MLEQQGNALTAVAFYTETKVGKTGLTVTCDVYELNSTTPIVSGGSATELGGGAYYYTLSSGSVDADALYLFIFKTSTTSVDQQWIPALWVVGRTWVNNVNATVSSRSSHTAADVWSSTPRTLTSFGTLVADIWSNVIRTITGGSLTTNPPTANEIADQVWDEVLAGHTTAGTTGEALDNAGGGNAVTAENIWEYPSRTITGATVSGAEIADVLDNDIITIRRGDSISISFTGLGVLTGYTSLWFTIANTKQRNEADSTSRIHIRKNASDSGDGLLYLNSEPAANAALGEITIDDASAGDITVTLDENASYLLVPVDNKPFDIQMLKDGNISTLREGVANITADVTRAII